MQQTAPYVLYCFYVISSLILKMHDIVRTCSTVGYTVVDTLEFVIKSVKRPGRKDQ